MMTVLKNRPGVVLTEIADEYYLIAAKSLLKQCPYLTQINESSAFLWRILEKGCCRDSLLSAVMEEYELDDPQEAEETIEQFIQQLIEMNYLITIEPETEKNEQ